MTIRVLEASALLAGPFSFVLMVGVYLGRRLCPEIQWLYEMSEPMVIVVGVILALAVAGLIAPAL